MIDMIVENLGLALGLVLFVGAVAALWLTHLVDRALFGLFRQKRPDRAPVEDVVLAKLRLAQEEKAKDAADD